MKIFFKKKTMKTFINIMKALFHIYLKFFFSFDIFNIFSFIIY